MDTNSTKHNPGNEEPLAKLASGRPGPEMLRGCNEYMMECTKALLSNESEERFTFQYGPCRGDPDFCDELASFLTEEYGDKVQSDDIFVTAGATQGLHLVATVMFDKNTPVFIEDPTYFIASKILRTDLGLTLIPDIYRYFRLGQVVDYHEGNPIVTEAVPTDDEGIMVDVLEKLLIEHKPALTNGLKTPFWSFVYTIPTFNNPKGYCMSEGKDDEDFTGNVVSNGTFSKILAPGLRLGWIEAPPRIMQFLQKCNTAWSGGAFNHYTSKLMTTALKDGLLQKHLVGLRQEYGERMELVCRTLKEHLPDTVKFHNPSGGFFIWLELHPSIDSVKLLELATAKYGVNFIHGASTSPTGKCQNCARLSISYCDKKSLQKGAKNFCDAVKDLMT